MLTLLLFIILFASVAMLYAEGLWGNAIRLVNVVTAALLATNYYEPLARWLENFNETFGTYMYVWDFVALWGLFAVFMVIFRAVTDALSRVKVRFMKIVDRIGSAVLALWVGWVMVCFTAFSLHTAPLAEQFLGMPIETDSRIFLGLGPDRQWLAFMQTVSRGQFSRTGSKEELKKKAYGVRAGETDEEKVLCVFDRNAEFLLKYRVRRKRLESYNDRRGAVRVRPADRGSQYDK